MTYLDILEDSDRYLMFDFDWVWNVSLAWFCTRHLRDEDGVAPNLDARMCLLLENSILNHEIVGKNYEDLFPFTSCSSIQKCPTTLVILQAQMQRSLVTEAYPIPCKVGTTCFTSFWCSFSSDLLTMHWWNVCFRRMISSPCSISMVTYRFLLWGGGSRVP